MVNLPRSTLPRTRTGMTTRYLKRYLAGEHGQVWAELRALGPHVRDEPVLSDARAVAGETMRRVRRNCERIIARLGAAGYTFGVYTDGAERYPEGAIEAHPGTVSMKEFDEHGMAIPLSLEAFWKEVGWVCLVGMHPSLPFMSDALEIGPVDEVLAELDEWEAGMEHDDAERDDVPSFEAALSADAFHKDNVSGGESYAVRLPGETADFPLLHERHGLDFIPYLRLALLRWGGFPGLDGREGVRFDLADRLIEELEPF